MGVNADGELRLFFRAESALPQRVSICVGMFQNEISTKYSVQTLTF